MRPPIFALVGGFLGAGKTTLILHAARVLERRGLRAAAILNDQENGLVDTRYAQVESFDSREVAGGCFCCRFSELMDAARQLRAYCPDVIFAEPVGSCMDLSATIVQPLKAFHRGEYRLAPLTVLADPALAERIRAGAADPDVSYLFQNQLAEADIVCLTKSDLWPDPPQIPAPVDFRLSARTGESVDEWLAEILEIRRPPGARVLDPDYARYAEAEASLGWFNLKADLRLAQAANPASVAGPLLDEMDEAMSAAGIRIAHLKIFDSATTGYIKASICTNGEEPEPEGDLLADPAIDHEVLINLRASGDPVRLREIAVRALDRLPGAVTIRRLSAFRPAPPRPEHRFGAPL